MKQQGTSKNLWRVDAAGVVACAMLTFAAWLAGAEPLMRRQQHNAAQAQQLAEQRTKQQQLLAANREVKTRLTLVEQALERAQVNLQSAKLVNQRIAALTAMANEKGLEVQSINSGALVAGPRFSQLPIRMTCTGSYRTAAAFLHSLQQTCHDTAVTAFELSDNTTDSRSASFSLQLVWYVLPAASK